MNAPRRQTVLIAAALVVWGFLIVFLPPALPSSAWPVMLVPTAACATALLTAPRLGGMLPKAATVLVGGAVIAGQLVAGGTIDDVGDLAIPALTLVCVLLFVKAAAGWSQRRAPALRFGARPRWRSGS